jgi:hypothetical protein
VYGKSIEKSTSLSPDQLLLNLDAEWLRPAVLTNWGSEIK